MDDRAFASAKEKLENAKRKLAAMKAATNLNDLADRWSEFLTEVQRFYTRLMKATEHGPSKGWFDQVKNLRKTDPLLRYVHHARNADEHGIERITARVRTLTIGDPGEYAAIEHLEIGTDGQIKTLKVTQGTVRWHPEQVIFVAVVDRGETYQPPMAHLGNPICSESLISVAELAIQYLDSLISEASEKFGVKL
jgi:hypothetical protein